MALNGISPLRLTGMASQLDTDGIIKSLMQIEQMKIDRHLRSRTTLLWRQEALNNVSKELTAFRNKYFSVMSADNIVSESVFNTYKAVSGNSDAVTAQTTVGAKKGSITFDSIEQIAQAARAESDGAVSADGFDKISSTNNMQLGSLALKTPLFGAGQSYISFSINDVSFTFSKTDTLQDMFDKVNNSSAGVNMSYDRLTDRFTIESKTIGKDSKLEIKNGVGNAFNNYVMDEYGYKVDKDGMLETTTGSFGIDIIGKARADESTVKWYALDADGNITHEVDKSELAELEAQGICYTGRAAVQTISTGEGSSATFGPKIAEKDDGTLDISSSSVQQGHGAKFTINGKTVERDTNTFEADGVIYTLNGTTDKKTTITISTNADAAVEKIKGFVAAYNELVTSLSGKVGERKSIDERKYTPLTDTEREAMTEKDIEAWEAIAKKGILYRDAGIDTMLRKMRSAFYDSIEGSGVAASSIGLKMSPFSTSKNGLIELDENKLRQALEEDPEKVMSFFTNVSESKDASKAYSENGLVTRITNIFSQYSTGSNASSLSNIQQSIEQANKKISDMNDKMQKQQEKLYLKYAAMEEALSQMQSQTSWLSSLMGQSAS